MLLCRLCRVKLTLMCHCVDYVEGYWPWYAHVSTLSTEIDPLICHWVDSVEWATLIWSYANSVEWNWPDMPLCRLCRLKSNILCSFVYSVDLNRPWYAHVPTLSNHVDPDWPLSRLCRLKTNVIGSCVGSVDWNWPPWYTIVSTLSIEIDPNMRICWLCLLTLICQCVASVEWYRPWYAHVSTLSTRIDPLICHWVDSVEWNWPWYNHMPTLSTGIDPDMPLCRFSWYWQWYALCRLCRMKLTLLCYCVDSVSWNWPWYAHLSNLST